MTTSSLRKQRERVHGERWWFQQKREHGLEHLLKGMRVSDLDLERRPSCHIAKLDDKDLADEVWELMGGRR